MRKMPKNDWKWQKMTQQMLKNETGDWNILERTQKKSKGLSMVQNDKKWQSVIVRKMTENDKQWHKKDQEYVLKLMWHPNIN